MTIEFEPRIWYKNGRISKNDKRYDNFEDAYKLINKKSVRDAVIAMFSDNKKIAKMFFTSDNVEKELKPCNIRMYVNLPGTYVSERIYFTLADYEGR